jgi:hypothetical protein
VKQRRVDWKGFGANKPAREREKTLEEGFAYVLLVGVVHLFVGDPFALA